MKTLIIIYFTFTLLACGTPSSRIHEKQRTPSDIKISHLDLNDKTINLRFDYRSNREKTLVQIDCDIKFNNYTSLNLSKQLNINLGVFSTEVLHFENIKIDNLKQLFDTHKIDYEITCELDYDKGREYVKKDSILHLVPASKNKFR